MDTVDDELEFDGNVFLLGDIFLKNFYSVFSVENKTASVSLALSKHYNTQAGIHKIRSYTAGYVLSMFIMVTLSVGSFYIYGSH